jgi:hypothetical protein
MFKYNLTELNHQSVAEEKWVRRQGSVCGACDEQIGTGEGFISDLLTSVFPYPAPLCGLVVN